MGDSIEDFLFDLTAIVAGDGEVHALTSELRQVEWRIPVVVDRAVDDDRGENAEHQHVAIFSVGIEEPDCSIRPLATPQIGRGDGSPGLGLLHQRTSEIVKRTKTNRERAAVPDYEVNAPDLFRG